MVMAQKSFEKPVTRLSLIRHPIDFDRTESAVRFYNQGLILDLFQGKFQLALKYTPPFSDLMYRANTSCFRDRNRHKQPVAQCQISTATPDTLSIAPVCPNRHNKQ